MFSKNLQRGIVALNKEHFQDLFPHTFYGKSSSTNYATCHNESHKFVRFIQRNRPVVVSSGTMCLCNDALLDIPKRGLIKKMWNEERGLPRVMRHVEYDVGPAQIPTILCCCSHPAVTWEKTERLQWNPFFPKRVC